MIDRQALLSDLQKLLKKLEADLLERSESADVPEVGDQLRREFEEAKQAERTAQSYSEWRSDQVTQAAAAWVISCVFARFLEDNRLIEPPVISGPGERLQRARDEHEVFFRTKPTLNDRDYLLGVFDGLSSYPATKEVFGSHNPIRDVPQWLSGDAAGLLIAFFQRIDANSGAARPRFFGSGLGHPLSGRFVSRPVGGRTQEICTVANAGVCRGVYPGSHARSGDRGVRIEQGRDMRIDCWPMAGSPRVTGFG